MKSVYKGVSSIQKERVISSDAGNQNRVVELEGDVARLTKLLNDRQEELKKVSEEIQEERSAFERQFNEEKEELLKKREEEALFYINQGKELYDEILREATRHQDLTISVAEKRAKEIIDAAEEKKAFIFDEAVKEGREKGYEDGLKKGDEQFQVTFEKFERIVAEVLKKRDEVLDELKGDVASIILNVARKVVMKISEENKETALRIVENHIDKMKAQGKILIRINTRDVELLEKSKRLLMEKIGGVESLDIIEDSSVEPGGCIIETSFSKIDARISRQISRIENVISQTDIE